MAAKIIYPFRKNVRKSGESQRVLDVLDAYLESNVDEPIRWLCRFWRDQGAAVTYRELREIVTGEAEAESLLSGWFHDYSRLLADKMTPMWQEAYAAGRRFNPLVADLALDIRTAEENVRQWILTRTGELITNCCDEQIKAVRYIVAEAHSKGLPSAETARYIRPTVGLTERQAEANFKHYNAVREQLRADHPRMSAEVLERKAREAAAKYAEKQQRYRAETIARTEIATAYSRGNDDSIRQGIAEGYLPMMRKEWSTAQDGNVCPACDALEGMQIDMDDEFKTKSGRREVTTDIPPLHPRCKCAIKYVEVDEE